MTNREVLDKISQYIYEKQDDSPLIRTETEIINALLRHIPVAELEKYLQEMKEDDSVPYEMTSLVNWFIKHQNFPIPEKNESIRSLLNMFTNKKSGKVAYARERLKKRYDSQSYADQKKILIAFLQASKVDRIWAEYRLRDRWDPCFEALTKEVWTKHKDNLMSSVVLKHLPTDFVIQEQEALSEVAGYAKLCARIGNEDGFSLDWERLSLSELFYVKAKLNLPMFESDAGVMLCEMLRRLNYLPNRFCSELCRMEDVSKTIWALGKLGMKETLIKLLGFQEEINHRLKDNPESCTYKEMKLLLGVIENEETNLDGDAELFIEDTKLPDEFEDPIKLLENPNIPENVKHVIKELEEFWQP